MTGERRDCSTRPWASSGSLLSWPEFTAMPDDQRMGLSDSKIGQAVAHVMLICPSQKLWVGAESLAERWLPLWRAVLAKHRATTEPGRPADSPGPRELEVQGEQSFAQWLNAKAEEEGAPSSPVARHLMRRTLAHLAEREGDDELKQHLSATDVLPGTTVSD